MTIICNNSNVIIKVDELPNGKKRVSVNPLSPSIFISHSDIETSYSLELIKLIFSVKGASYLCDEIAREEDPEYVGEPLKKLIFGYIDAQNLMNHTILDFGCGCGSSTMNLAKIFPQTQIIGIELCQEFVKIAEARRLHYNFDNVTFLSSPNASELPKKLENFDFIILNAVYEHLLPHERKTIVPQLWSLLKPEGILFINETPYRYFPIELHTTGLPLINYFPDKMTMKVARAFSKRIDKRDSWESLLRQGIRGTTEKEIINNICQNYQDKTAILKPKKPEINDRIDLWYASSSKQLRTVKKIAKFVFKSIKLIFGVTLLPSIDLAIQKK
ncbi:MAG: class I SAM-dependent methyltransferase [Rhizonema sp. PD37]|nr:class I SAM-dependent methyltransferase [Rhizonema sp. PD37]